VPYGPLRGDPTASARRTGQASRGAGFGRVNQNFVSSRSTLSKRVPAETRNALASLLTVRNTRLASLTLTGSRSNQEDKGFASDTSQGLTDKHKKRGRKTEASSQNASDEVLVDTKTETELT
jgi:hypothetical protein